VQVVCIFRGRQMAHPEHGYDVMKRVAPCRRFRCRRGWRSRRRRSAGS
jgi:hypothetical protein